MELAKINEMLDLVNDAKNKVNEVRGDAIFVGGNHEELQAVTRVFNSLEGVESSIMLARDDAILGNMEAASERLQDVNAQLKKDIKELKKIAKDVAEVAIAIGVVVDIVAKILEILL